MFVPVCTTLFKTDDLVDVNLLELTSAWFPGCQPCSFDFDQLDVCKNLDTESVELDEDLAMLLGHLDVGITETDQAVRDSVHRFASEVMRPAGQILDKLDPDAVIADDSVLWEVLRRAVVAAGNNFDPQAVFANCVRNQFRAELSASGERNPKNGV